jgi:pimeloyl-ACP methyl ester carboxylesterase
MHHTASTNSWTGMVAVDDTALAVTDTGGPGIPVLYLNGQFSTQSYWRRVIAELGAGWRHITYDERARGKQSKPSADYSFAAWVRDVDAVVAARGVERPLLVGWSYGAFVAAHWASRHPDRTLGAVLVDGAYPYDWLDEAMEQRIRKLFRRIGWFSPVLRPLGLAPRMTAEQQADSNIELGVISRERELGPVLDNIIVPVRYVVASGTSFGSRGDEQERVRTSLGQVTARNPNIKVSAKVASNHGAILRKDFRAIAEAVREVATLDRRSR